MEETRNILGFWRNILLYSTRYFDILVSICAINYYWSGVAHFENIVADPSPLWESTAEKRVRNLRCLPESTAREVENRP